MAKVVYKYQLNEFKTDQEFRLPKNARILKVDEQDQMLFMWVAVDPDEPIESFHIEVLDTGRMFPDLKRLEVRHHLNSVVMSNGSVWHIFQILKVSPKQ